MTHPLTHCLVVVFSYEYYLYLTHFSIGERSKMAESQQLLEEIVLPDEIQRYRTVFEKAKEANQVTDQNKFSFAYCLVRSKVKTDVRHGLQLLKELYDSTSKDSDKRDYLYYMALGECTNDSLSERKKTSACR